jgi:hypothetical protein
VELLLEEHPPARVHLGDDHPAEPRRVHLRRVQEVGADGAERPLKALDRLVVGIAREADPVGRLTAFNVTRSRLGGASITTAS